MPRWWPARWASPASSAAARRGSSPTAAASRSASGSSRRATRSPSTASAARSSAGALPMTAPAASNPDLGFLLGEADRPRRLPDPRPGHHPPSTSPRCSSAAPPGWSPASTTSSPPPAISRGSSSPCSASASSTPPTSAALEATIAETFEPLLRAAGDAEVGIRAIDFLADEFARADAADPAAHRLPAALGAGGDARAAPRPAHRARHRGGAQRPPRTHPPGGPPRLRPARGAGAPRALPRGRAGRISAGAYLTSPRGALLAAGSPRRATCSGSRSG